MLEYAKEIVIAMVQSGYIIKTSNNDTNIENVKKAIKEVYSELKTTKN